MDLTKILHKHIPAKTPKVLGATSAKFLADDIFTRGNGAQSVRKIFNFPKREACMYAASLSRMMLVQYDKCWFKNGWCWFIFLKNTQTKQWSLRFEATEPTEPTHFAYIERYFFCRIL